MFSWWFGLDLGHQDKSEISMKLLPARAAQSLQCPRPIFSKTKAGSAEFLPLFTDANNCFYCCFIKKSLALIRIAWSPKFFSGRYQFQWTLKGNGNSLGQVLTIVLLCKESVSVKLCTITLPEVPKSPQFLLYCCAQSKGQLYQKNTDFPEKSWTSPSISEIWNPSFFGISLSWS